MHLRCSPVELVFPWRVLTCYGESKNHVTNLGPGWELSGSTGDECKSQLGTGKVVGEQAGFGTSFTSTAPRGRRLAHASVNCSCISLVSTALCLKASLELHEEHKVQLVNHLASSRFQSRNQDREQKFAAPRDELENWSNGGRLHKALHVLLIMDEQGIVPPARMYRSLLKACSRKKALAQAKRVLAHLERNGIEITTSLGECVVTTLVKCGDPEHALRVFLEVPQPTVVSWSALISGYAMSGQSQTALRMYEAMLKAGIKPNTYTYVSVLKACGGVADLEEGRRIHNQVVHDGFDSDLLVGSCLVDMYGKCGSIEDAYRVFSMLPRQDVVSWTIILAAYTRHGQPQKALQLYEAMLEAGISPNDRCFVTALQACVLLAEGEESVNVDGRRTKLHCLKVGHALHSHAWRRGYHWDVFVGSTLVAMYGKCGIIENAKIVFDNLLLRDVVSWTAIIMAFSEQGLGEKGLHLYVQMQQEGISPDARTIVASLQACAMLGRRQGPIPADAAMSAADSLQIGVALHAHAWRKGYDEDMFVSSALVTMYGSCASIPDMKEVFKRLADRDVVSWNSLFAVYIEQCQAEQALQLYEQMLEEGISPSGRTFVAMLQACCILADNEGSVMVGGTWVKVHSLRKGKELHALARKNGWGSDVFVENTLVHMYGKCGSMADAQDVFDGLSQPRVVSWNAMIAMHVAKGQAEMALELYRQMKEEGQTPDEVTELCILQACGRAGSLSTVKHVHHTLVSNGDLQNAHVASTLITAYGKCASMVDAQSVFDALQRPDLVLWNALLAAYARQGNATAIQDCYELMRVAKVAPDDVTFLSLLSGCSHAGLVEKGVEYFESMSRDYGITPSLEHYSSMVDLFGRAGLFKKLEELLSTMPMQPDLGFWLGVLSTCRKHREVVLGRQAFEFAIRLEPKHSAAYVLMSNIYADAGIWHCAKEVRELERKALAWEKSPGQSWIQHENDVHTFLVGESTYVEHGHRQVKVSSERQDVPPRQHIQVVAKAELAIHMNLIESKKQQILQRTRPKDLRTSKPLEKPAPLDCRPAASVAEHDLKRVQGPLCAPFARPGRLDFLSLCRQGGLRDAMNVLLEMDHRGIIPSVAIYICLLKVCTKRKTLTGAKRVHVHLANHGLESTTILGEYVVNTFVKCSGVEDALQVFHRLPRKNVATWTTIISGLTTFKRGREALRMYGLMQEEGVEPDAYIFASLLKACGSTGDLQEGRRIHAEALRFKCNSDIFVGNCLINMYGKCGSILDAQNAFEQMPQRDIVSWNVMLMVYVKHGQAEKAVNLYEHLQEDSSHPNSRTFVSTLQAFGMLAEQEDAVMVDGRAIKVRALEKGKVIHADACKRGHALDAFVGSTLINMYGKCGSILDAQIVFDRLPHSDVVTWNAIMAAYVEQGQAEKVLKLYKQLLTKDISPNDRTFVSALQACNMLASFEQDVTIDVQCTNPNVLSEGLAIHADAQRKGYESDEFVGSTLVSMYGKYGKLEDAQRVFNGLARRNVVSWTALLGAYAEQGQAENALGVYRKMQQDGISPDARTIATALQACSKLAELEGITHQVQPTKLQSLVIGKALHADAQRRGYGTNVFVASSLICMYGKCGSIAEAYNVFASLTQRNVVSWNAILAVCVEKGEVEKAVHLYERMGREGISPNSWTVVITLQAWGIYANMKDVMMDGISTRLKCLEKGREIHKYATRKGFDVDVFVGNALVSMYGKCGSIADAQQVFDGLTRRNVVSWNLMVSACVIEGQAGKALQLYRQMQREGMSPDVRTVLGALQSCGVLAEKLGNAFHDDHVRLLELGKVIHAEARNKGYDSDVFVGSSLVSMYSKCGSIVDAKDTFDQLSRRDAVSWNAMLAAYVLHGEGEKALDLYEKMHSNGVSADDGTFVSVLQACGILAECDASLQGQMNVLMKGRAIHADARRKGYDSDIFVRNTLVSMYSKCASLDDAQEVFDELSDNDAVSWNALVTAYVENGQPQKALQLYRQIEEGGVTPNEVDITCILRACGRTGSLSTLQEIHRSLIIKGNRLSSLATSTLISAYGRCSSMADAQSVFDAISHLDGASWNALIASYARQGNYAASLYWYSQMQRAGFKPDGVTFLSLLSGCSHAGLVNEGVDYFASMSRDYGIIPEMDHYLSMANLFGRAGCFAALDDFLSSMPVEPNLSIWLCVLGCCQKHGQVWLGEKAFSYAVRVQPKNSAAYVMMSNIYSGAGMWDSAKKVRALREEKAAWKPPGQSWIEHKQEIHSFVVGDRNELPHEDVYDLLRKANPELM